MCPKLIQKYLTYTQTRVFTPTTGLIVGQLIFPSDKRRIGFHISTNAGNSGSVILTGPNGEQSYLVFNSPNNNLGWDLMDLGATLQGTITNNQANLTGVTFLSISYLDGFFD